MHSVILVVASCTRNNTGRMSEGMFKGEIKNNYYSISRLILTMERTP